MKSETTAAVIIIIAIVFATWRVFEVASEPRIIEPAPCSNEFGHRREPEWCAERDEKL